MCLGSKQGYWKHDFCTWNKTYLPSTKFNRVILTKTLQTRLRKPHFTIEINFTTTKNEHYECFHRSQLHLLGIENFSFSTKTCLEFHFGPFGDNGGNGLVTFFTLKFGGDTESDRNSDPVSPMRFDFGHILTPQFQRWQPILIGGTNSTTDQIRFQTSSEQRSGLSPPTILSILLKILVIFSHKFSNHLLCQFYDYWK